MTLKRRRQLPRQPRRPSRYRGAVGVEFVVSTTIFLIAFWFIYLQATVFLTPQLVRPDQRLSSTEFYSTRMISDPGTPETWTSWQPTEIGLADYDGGALPNILNKTKLDAVNGRDCADVTPSYLTGLNFAFEVNTSTDSWYCNSNFTRNNVIERPVYVHRAGSSYDAGIFRAWSA